MSAEPVVDTVELRTIVPADALEALEPLLWLLSPSGILTEDAGCLGARELAPEQCRASIYVAPAEVEGALASLRAAFDDLGLAAEIACRDIAREDWNRVWKSHFRPFQAGRRVRIEPSWMQGPDVEGIVRIAIDPGLAFGTGTHETTRLALCTVEDWADDLIRRGGDPSSLRMLDVGTGSAILCILGVRLGVGHAIGTEVDPDAVDSARDNLVINHLEDRIDLVLAEDPATVSGGPFDLVVANIISSVLLLLRDRLLACTRPGGTLILSGILGREVDEVRDAFAAVGLQHLRTSLDGEWASLWWRRP